MSNPDDDVQTCLHCHFLDAIEAWTKANGGDITAESVDMDKVIDAIANLLGQTAAEGGVSPSNLGKAFAELMTRTYNYYRGYRAAAESPLDAHAEMPAGARTH